MKSQLGCIRVILYGLLAVVRVTNATPESMLVVGDGIRFKVQRYDEYRILPYRLVFWQDGMRSIYNFYGNGYVRLIRPDTEEYRVVYRTDGSLRYVVRESSRRDRALAGYGQGAEETYDHEEMEDGRRLFATCGACEEAWDVVCGQGVLSVCALEKYGDPLQINAQRSMDTVCTTFADVCDTFASASEACTGQCEVSTLAPTPAPVDVTPETPIPTTAPMTPEPIDVTPETPIPTTAPMTPAPIDVTPETPIPTPAPMTPAPIDVTPETPIPTTAPMTPAPVDVTPETPIPTPAPMTPAPIDVIPETPIPTPAPMTPAPVDVTPETPIPTTAPMTPAPIDVTPETPIPTTAPMTPAPVDVTPETPIPTPVPESAPVLYPVVTPSPPTPVTTLSTTCDGDLPSLRWAGTTAPFRLYMEGEGCGTMTDLYNFRSDNNGPKGPLYILDENNDPILTGIATPTGKWLLTAELYMREGAVLYCRGTDLAGGDCDELRIQSTGPDDYYEIRGHGGSLYFENTLVTSWDTPNKSVQMVHEEGRSFLNCLSEKAAEVECEGQSKNDYGECRMDIINSEMSHMGFFEAESYGLTWKVRGFCKDRSNMEVFHNTNVYGDIKGSNIHHMYYGMYSYGHQGGVWTHNEVHDNYQYGFDPHDDSDYLTIAYNKVYNNVNHGIIASKRCNHVEIYDNEVYHGGAQAVGIFMHRSGDDAKIYNNNVHDMNDAGVALLESFNAEIYDNTFNNVTYGVRLSMGSANNYVHDNVIEFCTEYGFYIYRGTDIAEQTVDGRPGDNTFENNDIIGTPESVKLQNCDDTIITGNDLSDVTRLRFDDAIGTEWSGNTVSPDSACTSIVDDSTFTATSSGLPADC